MTPNFARFAVVAAVLFAVGRAAAETTVVVNVNRAAAATAEFTFADVPVPSRTDAANAAAFTLLTGERDRNGADLSCLNDGLLPSTADEPRANYFFAAGTDGGRLLVDLGQSTVVRRVATYSWHPGPRGPQVYRLYGAAAADGFEAAVAGRREQLDQTAWTLLADVDSRPNDDADAAPGGQYGVVVSAAADEPLGSFRYLLFAVARTGRHEWFDNTFYSEIDVDDGEEHPPAARPPRNIDVVQIGDDYEIAFDTSQTPELRDWVRETLQPICIEWYPKIVAMLPSDGFAAPRRFTIKFEPDMQGVAYTAGLRVVCAEPWFRDNLDGEAAGAVVHELVHVVQRYGRARRRGSDTPGWLVEGLADYIRWFLYEPEELRPRPNPDRAHYTDSYRTTGAFLNYVVGAHGDECIPKLNAAMRNGAYSEDMWTELTGKSVDELWADYVRTLRK